MKEGDPKVRRELQYKVGFVIKQTEKEIAAIENQRVASSSAELRLIFEYEKFDDWLQEHVKSVHLEGPGSEQWQNTFV